MSDVAPWGRRAGAAGAWTVGFAPVLLLALHEGGWDPLLRDESGIVSWILGVGLLALRARTGPPVGRRAGVALGLLGAFVAWCALAMLWTQSLDTTWTELSREASYLGFLTLAVAALDGSRVGAALGGLLCALVVVATLAVVSALDPGVFGAQPELVFFPGSRLSYPIGYSDADGELLALGLVLALGLAVDARPWPLRGLAAAAVPVFALAGLMTASRGGVLTAGVGIAVLLLAGRRRAERLLAGLVAGAGSAAAIAALLARRAVADAVTAGGHLGERHAIAGRLGLACLGVLVLWTPLTALLRRRGTLERRAPGRRSTGLIGLAGAVAAVVAGLALGLPHRLAAAWRTFRALTPTHGTNVADRLGSLAGSHRYQYWTVALHAFEAHPVLGIGPGVFPYYWARHEPFYEFVLNAHSLYLETMAETGLVGIGLLGGLFLWVVVGGLRRVGAGSGAAAGAGSRAAAAAGPRAGVAPDGGGCRDGVVLGLALVGGFAIAAAVDWVWQLPALVVVFVLAAAAVLAADVGDRRGADRSTIAAGGARASGIRGLLGLLAALAGLLAVALPYAELAAIRASQGAAAAGHTAAAFHDARLARILAPGTGEGWTQTALLFERDRDLAPAARDIARATAEDPDDWELWLLRARIDAEAGEVPGALAAYRQAHRLDPLSPLTALG